MRTPSFRSGFVLLALALVAAHVAGAAQAQSSLGIGTNEAVLPSSGLFSGFLNWVNVQQQGFYRSLTGALKEMRDGGSQPWLLIGLSFAYGVFHAAGPGHGKAVISSYMLANEVALRRGIVLSFISAFLQAATAIVLMAALFLVLRGTSVSMTNATWFLEVASYVLVTAFGAWLLRRKALPALIAMLGGRPAYALSAARTSQPRSGFGCSDADHVHGPECAGHGPGLSYRSSGKAGGGFECSVCGHSHAPDPAQLSGDRFDWRSAWSAVVAVGVRPCSGALIVLTFAFMNGLWAGGVLSVLAMALGTAITVSILATLAVGAKNWAVAFAGDGRMGNRVHSAIEIAGAAMVFLLGLTLLSASLSAGGVLN